MSKRKHIAKPDLMVLYNWYLALKNDGKLTIDCGTPRVASHIRSTLYQIRDYDRETFELTGKAGEYPLARLSISLPRKASVITIGWDVFVQIGMLPKPAIDADTAWTDCQIRLAQRDVAEAQQRGLHAIRITGTVPEEIIKAAPEPEDDLPTEPEVKPEPKPEVKSALAFTQPPTEPSPPPVIIDRAHLYEHPEFVTQLRNYQQVNHTLTEEQILFVSLRRTAKKIAPNGMPAEQQAELPLELQLELTAAANKATQGP